MNIFITGVTGFLGGELLVDLSKRREVSKIYCLVRNSRKGDIVSRMQSIFDLHNDFFDKKKVIPIAGDLIDAQLPDLLSIHRELNNVNVIIHSAANTSFARTSDEMVERVNIHGLENMLKWAKTLKHLKTFIYVGTATICGKNITHRVVTEDESPNEKAHHLVKYTFTKMKGEMLLHKYLPEEKILVVRPSIIMGDSRPVFPRSPVILWTLATANLLRLIPVNADANVDIIPVDYASASIIALIFAKRKHNIYHISAGVSSFSTSHQLSVAIQEFAPERPPFKFVNKQLINPIKRWAARKPMLHNELLPYNDYLEYWSEIFGENGKLRILLIGLEPYLNFIELGQVFDNSRLLSDTSVGKSIPAHDYIRQSIQYLDKIDIFEAALEP